ncbi:alpha/beta hydrolase [Rhodococcus sp. G-MC3]|uniref:alpha/beta hydrolase n=1 Tax=Rhodococcus sp. G-MC3 TaxID=3046209 RepID=UPI0024B9E7D5|nr:alpha/beta hydrolase [Rhodococcus sp. G-MC3]MDJ0396516.1 alpha/beta hydrolase [Rhodococcus sp. G-MC3]
MPPINPDHWNDDLRAQRLKDTRLGAGWGALRRTLVRMGWLLVVVAVVSSFYYVYDVRPERERLARTNPRLYHVYDAQDRADDRTAVVDLAGLGILDATHTAHALPALALMGQVWAVQYDNAGLDTAVISELITRRAHQRGVTQIVVVGHSMGGIIALEVATHLYEDTDLRLRAVMLDCTPVNLHAVRSRSRDAGEDMLRWMGWLPGARESRTLRVLVETVARKDRFVTHSADGVPSIDTHELYTVVTEVFREKIRSSKAASNSLIESQFNAIVASGAQKNLEALTAEFEDKPLPAFVFLRPKIGEHDPVVDVDYSQRVLFEQTGKPPGRLLVVRMPQTAHANPIQQPEVYNPAIETTVLPFLERIQQLGDASPAAGATEFRDDNPQ